MHKNWSPGRNLGVKTIKYVFKIDIEEKTDEKPIFEITGNIVKNQFLSL